MQNLAETRARFLADPLPKRLGALAAGLAQISACTRPPMRFEIVDQLIEESMHFIEWTAAETEPEIGSELVDMQIMLALWRTVWPKAQQNFAQLALFYLQAKKWSEQVLDYSGLLKEA